MVIEIGTSNVVTTELLTDELLMQGQDVFENQNCVVEQEDLVPTSHCGNSSPRIGGFAKEEVDLPAGIPIAN